MKKLLLVLLIGLMSAAAFAFDTSTTFQVAGYVNPWCYVYAGNLYFGSFNAGDADKYANTYVAVGASYGLPYAITLDAGKHYFETWRCIENSGYLVKYKLDRPDGWEWGDAGYANTYTWGYAWAGTGTGYWDYHTVYGTLWSSWMTGDYPTGMYTDTVTVTVYY